MIPITALSLALLSAPAAQDLRLVAQRGPTTTEDLRVVSLSPERQLTLTAKEAILWEVETGRELVRTPSLARGDQWVRWSVQEDQLLGLRSDGEVRRFAPDTLRALPSPAPSQAPDRCPKAGDKEDLGWAGGLSSGGEWAWCVNTQDGFRLLDLRAEGDWWALPAERGAKLSQARVAVNVAGEPVLLFPTSGGLTRVEPRSGARRVEPWRLAPWSPPGEAVFVQRDGGCALWRFGEDALLPVEAGLCAPSAREALHGGAQVLALVEDPGPGGRVVVLDMANGALRWSEAGVSRFERSPDGAQVFLRRENPERWELRDLQTGAPIEGLSEGPGEAARFAARAGAVAGAWWSEDGARVLVALEAEDGRALGDAQRSVLSVDVMSAEAQLAFPPGEAITALEPLGDGALLQGPDGARLWSGALHEAPTPLPDCSEGAPLRARYAAPGLTLERYAVEGGPDRLVDLSRCAPVLEGVAELGPKDLLLGVRAGQLRWAAQADKPALCEAPLAGGAARCQGTDRPIEPLVTPILTPDGGLIALTRVNALGGPGVEDNGPAFSVLQFDRAAILQLEDLELSRWDGQAWRRLAGEVSVLTTLRLSPDGRRLVVLDGGRLRLLDALSGATLLDVGLSAEDARLSPDGRLLLTTHSDGGVQLRSASDGALLATLMVFLDGSWAVIDPQRRFDRADEGVEGLHFVYTDADGAPESIGLEQLERYYREPRLLAKLVDPDQAPREVVGFDLEQLPPKVRWSVDGDTLRVSLEARGGGVGRVALFLNGQEVNPDLRPAGYPGGPFEVDLTPYARLRLGEGRDQWSVQAWGASERGASRGGAARIPTDLLDAIEVTDIDLYAVVVGTHRYEDPALWLDFPDDDAQVMAQALRAGGEALLGEAGGEVHLTLLSTADGETAPSAAALRAAFDDIAAEAEPWDLLVVYFSGHGVNQDGVYYYPWPEATGADLSDPRTLDARALSHVELMDLIRGAPPLKRLLILDTCEAGLAGVGGRSSLAEDAQARSLAELKRRMGMTILAGAPAGKAAYEDASLGHGLLTYALLEGLRGGALREERYWEVGALAAYATEAVPRIAVELGRSDTQEPVLTAPSQSTAWWFGARPADVDASIPLRPLSRPRLGGGQLVHAGLGYDALRLSEATSRALYDLERAYPVGYRWAPGGEADWRLGGLYDEDGVRLTLAPPEGALWRVALEGGDGEAVAACAARWTARVFDHVEGLAEAPPERLSLDGCGGL